MKATKKLLLIGLLASFGVLLGCAKAPSGDDIVNNSGANIVEETQDQNFVGTMQDLIKKEKPFICNVTYTENGTSIKGKIYSDGKAKRTRSEMEVIIGKQNVKSFVVQDGDTTYLRSDGSNKGTKMTTKIDNQNTDNGSSNQAKMNFICKKRDVENSMFEIPSSVQFTDFSKELEKIMKK